MVRSGERRGLRARSALAGGVSDVRRPVGAAVVCSFSPTVPVAGSLPCRARLRRPAASDASGWARSPLRIVLITRALMHLSFRAAIPRPLDGSAAPNLPRRLRGASLSSLPLGGGRAGSGSGRFFMSKLKLRALAGFVVEAASGRWRPGRRSQGVRWRNLGRRVAGLPGRGMGNAGMRRNARDTTQRRRRRRRGDTTKETLRRRRDRRCRGFFAGMRCRSQRANGSQPSAGEMQHIPPIGTQGGREQAQQGLILAHFRRQFSIRN